MDLVSRRYLIYVSQYDSQALSPTTSPGSSSIFHPHMHSSSTSFPIIAIAIIGIVATAFLLVSYYIFVIKCCLNWHRIDLLRRFSPSRRRQDPSPIYSPRPEPRGLDEAVIRLIPVIQYKPQQQGWPIARGHQVGSEEGKSQQQQNQQQGNREYCGERSYCECSICLNEFQEDEKLRIIPNCSHVFHIDCIDIWLLNNANCPLCRTSICLTSRFHIDQLLNRRPNSSSQDQTTNIENLIGGGDDNDFVVIELGNDHNRDNNNNNNNALELPTPCPMISPSPRKKVTRKLQKVISMGDECIDIRAKDEQFSVQPIRRSFSMDSSGDRQFYLAVQEALQQQHNNKQTNEVISSIEGCSGSSNGRVKKSFFSFGHGSGRSRSSVQPVYLFP